MKFEISRDLKILVYNIRFIVFKGEEERERERERERDSVKQKSRSLTIYSSF